MVQRIDGPQFGQTPEAAAELSRQATEGEYRGQTVVVSKDPLSLIQNASEELTFAAAEKVEKKLSERKADPKSRLDARVEKIMRMYVNHLEDTETTGAFTKFADRLRRIAQGHARPSQGQVRQEAREAFKDVTLQNVALSIAEEILALDEGMEDLLAAIHDAKETLNAEHGPEVRAGENVSEEALRFSEQGLGDTQELRDFYRTTVLGFDNITSTFEAIMNEYGEARFDEALEFLMKGAGNDLHSQGPSVAPEHLRSVVDDLYHVQVLGNIQRSFSTLLEKLSKLFNIPIGNPTEMMRKILMMTNQNFLRPEQILEMAIIAHATSAEERIYFLTAMQEQLRLLPLKIYKAKENRDKLLETSQLALDQAIEAENAEFEEEEE
ncbi:MAG: type III secretion system gatekeeper subunit SctW [Candidatus Methylacidiphilales bacterium]